VALVSISHVGEVPAPVLSQHQLFAKPPVRRIITGGQYQLIEDAFVVAACELQVEHPCRGTLTPPLQRHDLLAKRLTRHVRQRMLSSPQL
jgi:hypothetical protein